MLKELFMAVFAVALTASVPAFSMDENEKKDMADTTEMDHKMDHKPMDHKMDHKGMDNKMNHKDAMKNENMDASENPVSEIREHPADYKNHM